MKGYVKRLILNTVVYFAHLIHVLLYHGACFNDPPSLSVRSLFSKFEHPNGKRLQNERDAQKSGFDASRSHACRLRQAVSGH